MPASDGIVSADFFEGADAARSVDVSRMLVSLETARAAVQGWPVERIITALDRFAHELLDRSNPLHREYPSAGIPFIAQWSARRGIEAMLEDWLGNAACLDRFVRVRTRCDREYRAFPRGLVVHWIAGNVPTLGFLSLVVGMVTRNANILKLPSDATRLMSALLRQLAAIEPELARTVAAIRYDHHRRDIGEILSRAADVRVLWGSDETVGTVRALPARPTTVDLVFPNRTSFIVIDEASLAGVGCARLAKQVATDISIFEQKACASPHTIFLVTESQDLLERFARRLYEALQTSLRTLRQMVPSEREVAVILRLRAQYDMFHDAWYSDGTEFTILADNEFRLGPAVGNRTVYLRRIADPERLAALITPQVQSIGLAVEPALYGRLTEVLGGAGAHRFARLGAMTHFEMPWDGIALPQHLVRWVGRPTAGHGTSERPPAPLSNAYD